MKTGVYVGSFNPPHLGHLHVINFLIDQKYVDKVIVIPTGNYWHKNNIIDIKHRINMLKFYENENIIINNELNNLKYTYQILNILANIYIKDQLSLIIGDDNLEEFHLWKNYQELLRYNIIVLKRNNINYKDTFSYKINPKAFTIISNFAKIDISSTLIRDLLNGDNYTLVYKYMDYAVLKYIIDNNLYHHNELESLKLKKRKTQIKDKVNYGKN